MRSPLSSRCARVALTLAMTFVWTGGPMALAQQQQPSAPLPPSNEAIVAVLKRFVDAAKDELRKPGADPSDVPAKAAELGPDIEKSFSFVRDEVAYEPYRGVLRGARGALSARAANAYDKALLLKNLLEVNGHRATVVKGTLPDDKAAALVDGYLSRAASPTLMRFAEENADNAMPDELAKRLGLTADTIQKYLAQRRHEADAFMTKTREVTDAEGNYLRDQLQAAGVQLGRGFDAWKTELTKRAAEHVWVEVAGADGKSTVLDPTFTDARSGQTFGVNGQPAKVEADRHVVVVQLIYGRNDGKPEEREQTIVDVPIPAERALYDFPSFTIQPTDSVPAMSKIMEMDAKSLVKLWTGFKSYQAVVSIGGERFASRAFDLKGNVMDVGADGRVKGAAQVGAAIGGAFGGGLGGGGGEEKASTFDHLTVAITFKSPGVQPLTQRRTLVTAKDLSGDVFVSPVVDWRILIQPQTISSELASHGSLKSTIDTIDPILPMLNKLGEAQTLDRLSTVQPSTYPQALVQLAIVRQAELAKRLKDAPTLLPLIDRPQMAIAERRFMINVKDGKTSGRFGIDIVSNAMSVVPRDEKSAGAAAQLALRQGVFDTAAESSLAKTNPAAGQPAGTTSAIDSIAKARTAGGSLAVIAPNDAAAMAQTTLSEIDRTWITRHEQADQRVVAIRGEAGKLDSAWWSLDPETGNVIGRRDGGRGQSATEYIVQASTGIICMIFTVWNFSLDEKARGGTSNQNQREGAGVGILGCMVGGLFGLGGVGLAVAPASVLTITNAVIGGLFTMWGGSIGRRP
jgi:hypothetical protein